MNSRKQKKNNQIQISERFSDSVEKVLNLIWNLNKIMKSRFIKFSCRAH